VYLYNQNPGGTGSRGIACLGFALVDKNDAPLTECAWLRPCMKTSWDELYISKADKLIGTKECKSPGWCIQYTDISVVAAYCLIIVEKRQIFI